jgi:S-adenosylmethionine-diacylglycerol 3-amino-3-carboxypropyl transferase
MPSFLETLNYSSCNEDSRSELKALRINKRDSVLTITGSGARPLDLLIKQPAKIISIDFNPCQNFLLELKMAAMQQLEYEDYLNFLGVCPSQKRVQVYSGLRSCLSSDARGFWDQHPEMLKKGVIYQGRWEKYFLKLAQAVGLTRNQLRQNLFQSVDVTRQASLWSKKWDDIIWRMFLRLISSRFTWKNFLGDPGFYAYVSAQFSVYNYLWNKFSSASKNILLSQSPFASLLFFGKYDLEKVLPLSLQRKHYSTLRTNLSHIQIVTQSLLEFLERGTANQFQKYSLSDFSSYTNANDYLKIWRGIVRTAAAGAIVCERQFLVKRKIPHEVYKYVMRNKNLEKELLLHDDSIFYTFVIAQVNV